MAGTIAPAGDAALTLLALGRAELRAVSPDGESRMLLGPGKPLALVAYLALVPGRSATREQLVDLLWSDAEPDAARHALRQTLWHLRTKCGVAVAGAGRGESPLITLAAPVDSDRDAFLDAVADRRFEEAVDAYRGDFLPDVALPGGLEFEQWADVERQRLRATFHRCAEVVVRAWLEVPRHRDAIALARRVRDADPQNEATWRLLLETLIAARDSLGAASEADALEQLLAREEQEPEPATRALLRLARSQTAEHPTVGDVTLVTELVGRQAEFAHLLAAWEGAVNGAFHHAQIVAAAGLGKTRLLTDLHARLRAKRGRVVHVRAQPGDARIAGALVGELAHALAALPGAAAISPASARALIALDPRLSSVFNGEPDLATGADALRRRALALHELIVAVADEAPLAVLVDDLHWADDASVDMLSGAVARLAKERVLLVSSTRPGSAAAITPNGTQRIPLWPLSIEQVGAMLGSVAELPPAAWAVRLVAALHAATGGSPLLLLETVHHLMERGWLLRGPTDWKLGDESALFALLSAGSALRDRVRRCDQRERGVLRSLAVGGFPLDPVLLATDERSLHAVRATLEALEQRGLVSRVGDGWQPAHDEIAEAALAISTDEELGAARARLGASIAAWAADDSLLLRRAGPLLAVGGAGTELRLAFRRWVAGQRRSGDRRAPRAMATDFVGRDAPEHVVTTLARSLPLHRRMPRAAGWAAAALAVVGAGAAAIRFGTSATPATAPDALLLVVDTSGTPRGFTVPVRLAEMASGDIVDVDRVGTADSLALQLTLPNVALGPDPRVVAFATTAPDSGNEDVMLREADGHVRRLTDDPHDDIQPAWSPDGNSIVFATGRYDSLEHTGIAVMDIRTGRIRRVTGGPSTDYVPLWSPSGTHIAFARRRWDNPSVQLCRVAVDATQLRCFDAQGEQANILAWFDARRVLVALGPPGESQRIVLVNLFSGESTPVTSVGPGAVSASSDGRWVACTCRDSAIGRIRTIVFPTGRPDLVREVRRTRADERPLVVGWRPNTEGYLDTLTIVGSLDSVRLTAPTVARAAGRTHRGQPADVASVQWSTADSTVASVDSEGVVTPHRIGTTYVVASAGGWRVARRRISVVAPAARRAVRQDWADGFGSFAPFGSPSPVIYREGSLSAMWSRGDQAYSSGVYTRSPVDASRGVAVDFGFSLPLTMSQWQFLDVSIVDGADSARVARWDQHTGSPPFRRPDICAISLPGGEGVRGSSQLLLVKADRTESAPLAAGVRSGAWHALRLQLFPDGGCGVALDGRPVVVIPGRGLAEHTAIVTLGGASYRTRVLVGPVEIWTGVRPDVDWRTARAR